MLRVAIITLTEGKLNFGNRFQNYAVQEVFKSIGCDPYTVRNIPHYVKFVNKLRRFLVHSPAKNFRRIIRLLQKRILPILKLFSEPRNEKADGSAKYSQLLDSRKSAFNEFTKNFIKQDTVIIAPDDIPADFSGRYDAFVVGSDQVWNPQFGCGFEIGFLRFAPTHKRIAYAASIGANYIPEKLIEKYTKGLCEMAHISVREDKGAEIIRKLTGLNVPVLVDPTMMLSKAQWLDVSTPAAAKPCQPYLLTYFLGDVSQQDYELINKIASTKKLQIINMADIQDERHYTAGPGEFIDYLASSVIVCTDSFHGCVFSILFEKPFVVFSRNAKVPSMYSRIDTLLDKFNLESRKAENIALAVDPLIIEYSHVPAIVEKERNKSMEYLKQALNGATNDKS